MLLIVCMIAGGAIIYFGLKLSVATVKHAQMHENKKDLKMIAGLAICIIGFGIWMLANSMELYYYIVHNGLMELFF